MHNFLKLEFIPVHELRMVFNKSIKLLTYTIHQKSRF